MMVQLPACDRVLLQVAVRLVPAAERVEWTRSWHGELWHRRFPRRAVTRSTMNLYPGLLRDALWLRAESHRRALAGTVLLCLISLCVSVLLAAFPLYLVLGNGRVLFSYLAANAARFIIEGSLVTVVSFATAARFIEHSSRVSPTAQIRASLFQAVKMVLVLLIAFLFSGDITQPLHYAHPFTAELIQPQIFVVLALLALRWSFSDSEGRCKHCLRSLAMPTRVGRPSRNFLDSNGTELVCDSGHGLLSIPEMETSWRASSRWIAS
jgi:hypothetical protein